MNKLWRFYFLGYLLSLPHTIVGFLLAIAYRAHSWRWSDGCFEAIGGDRIFGQPEAQTHGWIIFYDTEVNRQYAPIRVHERVHVVQGFVGGPFYPLAYLACHVYGWIRYRDFWRAYEANWFERQAYAHQSEGWGA